MKNLLAILSLVCALVWGAVAPANAAEVFSDVLCPPETQLVIAFDTISGNPNSPAVDVVDAAKKASAGYDACAAEMLQQGALERMHYAQIRSAQFQVVAGRIQRLLEMYPEARASLEGALKLSGEVIDWLPPTSIGYASPDKAVGQGSNRTTDHRGSNYRDAALKIREAAQLEIGQLPKPGKPAT